MSINTYEGVERSVIPSEHGDDWHVTESVVRPPGMRWAASRHDGEASLMASTLEGLSEYVAEAEEELNEQVQLEQLEAALDAVAEVMKKMAGGEDLIDPLDTIQGRIHDSINELDEYMNPQHYRKPFPTAKARMEDTTNPDSPPRG